MGIKELIKYFITWRIILFVFLLLALQTIPLEQGFLGGGLTNYLKNPYIFSWLNFDGEHFLVIAQRGYRELEYFFFPLFPLLIRLVAKILSNTLGGYAVTGLLISNLAFFLGLIGLIKLVKLDFSENIVRNAIFLLLLFPTSFYFGSYYSESLFFALCIWAFYFARTKKWIPAGILGILVTATRVVGLALFPALIIESLIQFKKDRIHPLIPVLASFSVMLGFIAYAIFLNIETGDPLNFFHNVTIFGQQRAAGLIVLPQVFYRYIFKIMPNLDYNYFPVVFSTLLELGSAILFLILVIASFFKLRLSYSIYLMLGYIIPTLSGSFSSFPRYVLVLFPGFILMSLFLSRHNKGILVLLSMISLVLLGIATSLFVRGYWIA